MKKNLSRTVDERAPEAILLAQLQRVKTSYQTFIKLNYEHAAVDCGVCTTQGACCTDAHFVNVHITRLEAIAMRDTIERTPRLTTIERRSVYERARAAIKLYRLSAGRDTMTQTYSCPLYDRTQGCLVHRRAKPTPCIQHACYEDWQDLPPTSLQTRTEHRIEQLNNAAYGSAWAWLPTPVWLSLIDPESDGADLERLVRVWRTQRSKTLTRSDGTGAVRNRAALRVSSGTGRS